MPQSIKRGTGHEHHRNGRAVTLALKGRYVLPMTGRRAGELGEPEGLIIALTPQQITVRIVTLLSRRAGRCGHSRASGS